MKSITTISVDTDVLIEARKRNINLSRACNNALKVEVDIVDKALPSTVSDLKQELLKRESLVTKLRDKLNKEELKEKLKTDKGVTINLGKARRHRG